MSMQFAFGYNEHSPVVAKLITDKILKTAESDAKYVDNVEAITRDEAAYFLLRAHLHDKHFGFAGLPIEEVNEIRRQYPAAATRAEDGFIDWLHDI